MPEAEEETRRAAADVSKPLQLCPVFGPAGAHVRMGRRRAANARRAPYAILTVIPDRRNPEAFAALSLRLDGECIMSSQATKIVVEPGGHPRLERPAAAHEMIRLERCIANAEQHLEEQEARIREAALAGRKPPRRQRGDAARGRGQAGSTICVWVTTAHSLPASERIIVCHTMVVLPR